MNAGTPIPDYAIDPFDPGVSGTKKGFFESLFRMHDTSAQSVLPCIVRKFNAETNTVNVEPLVSWVVQKGSGRSEAKRPVYEDVPVLGICHGGFEISFPLFVGDTGLMISLDRNCDTAISKNSEKLLEDQSEDNLKNKGQMMPDDLSLAGFEHSVFIPFSFAPIESTRGELKISAVGDRRKYVSIDNGGMHVVAGEYSVDVGNGEAVVSNGTDKISLTDKGPVFDGKPDEDFAVATGLRYDKSANRMWARWRHESRRGDFIVKVSGDSEWVEVGG